MGDMPSIFKRKVSLQLDNEVIVVLDKKAADDNTSRNAVANYLLSSALQQIIDNFSDEDKAAVLKYENENLAARVAKRSK